MPTVEKIIEKMKNSPNSITSREIVRVLKNMGFIQTHRKGSHTTFFNNHTGKVIIIPLNNTIKECYVKDALEKIGEGNEK